MATIQDLPDNVLEQIFTQTNFMTHKVSGHYYESPACKTAFTYNDWGKLHLPMLILVCRRWKRVIKGMAQSTDPHDFSSSEDERDIDADDEPSDMAESDEYSTTDEEVLSDESSESGCSIGVPSYAWLEDDAREQAVHQATVEMEESLTQIKKDRERIMEMVAEAQRARGDSNFGDDEDSDDDSDLDEDDAYPSDKNPLGDDDDDDDEDEDDNDDDDNDDEDVCGAYARAHGFDEVPDLCMADPRDREIAEILYGEGPAFCPEFFSEP
ncbi:hypothetical protein OHC33_009182 [Knufia fluminis]|uniref:Uncharacterized protein n=1 Tax=Knufia fluminis TaxID=191047 RepID=A0AAN8EEQ9_9EURO|nr:hypothetical protein OHC33_009182 [Knufia fluminis]